MRKYSASQQSARSPLVKPLLSYFFIRLETNKILAASDRWLQLYIAQVLLIKMQTTRTQLAAPYFQVLRKLLHVDFLHEDEVPEADIGVYGHGGGLSLTAWA